MKARPRIHGTAFTLLELIITIGMIALLCLTLLPALAKSKPNSLAFQCLNNNRQLCVAWRMYADDSRDRIVYSSDDGTGSTNPLNQYAWTWSHMDYDPNNRANWDTNADIVLRPLWPYTGKNAGIYRCPADPSTIVVTNVAKPRVRSMSMNLYLGGFAGTSGGWSFAAPYRLFLKTTELTSITPAKVFVFLDMRWDLINWGNFITDMTGYPSNTSQFTFQGDYPSMVHDLGCSFSFGDGRAEIHRWVDHRTVPPITSTWYSTSVPSPGNPDIAWLQDHATRPK